MTPRSDAAEHSPGAGDSPSLRWSEQQHVTSPPQGPGTTCVFAPNELIEKRADAYHFVTGPGPPFERRPREALAQTRHPDGLDLDREDATGLARELRCENAVTGSDLEHEVAASDLRLPDELGGDGATSEEVLAVRATARSGG
jgi:hypothetical protein